MAYAIFKSGGKQYRVAAGDKLNVEKLDVAVGDTITFDEVLAPGPGRVALEPELVGEGEDLGLRRPDPLAADLDHVVGAGDRMVQQPPANPFAGLEHGDRMPGALQFTRGG